ncbi:MAG: S8 family serine peptidase [Chloroflexales bacterium]|nr:S8 family serine peptidase [Chloroflexales bacterium]
MLARTQPVLKLLTLLTLIVIAAAAPVKAQGPGISAPPGPTLTSDRGRALRLPQRWVVQLKDAPLAQSPAARPGAVAAMQAGAGRLRLDSPEALRYRDLLRQQRERAFSAIRQVVPGAQVQRRYDILFNGMGMTLPGAGDAAIARLRRLPNVAAVYPDRAYYLSTFSGVPTIGAEALWNSPAIGGQANAGKGIKIAIVDAGIRTDNPFFNPAGFSYPPGFPKGDPASTTPKVIAARAYFRPDLLPLEGSTTPQPGPEDDSHGTHVAGIAAGVAGTTATILGLSQTISGVAPRAYLMNYKVYYANEAEEPGAYSIELIAALEDAVADGADVINASWGSRPATEPSADPITVAADAAVAAGVTVVFSAGNSGPDPSTAGSPGFSDKVIAVGASTTPKTVVAGSVDVTAPEGAPESLREQSYRAAAFGPQLEVGIWGPFPYTPVSAVSDSTLACEPLPTGSLSGQIALIERGTCPFAVKVLNAQIGGANSALVYNSEQGGDALIMMGGGTEISDAVGIPSVFVGRSTGLALLDWRAQHGDAARLQLDARARIVNQPADVIPSFSARGPSFQASLKPDVVAPGFNILSSGYADGEGVAVHQGFGIVSGTSMAAPFVTGAAALLKQIHPTWAPADIKSALMATASTDVYLDLERSERATVLDMGAGRIDVSKAASVALLFDRPSLSFGNLGAVAGQPTRAELAVEARNVSGQAQSFSLAGSATGASAFGVSVTPQELRIPPGQTASFTVSVEIPAGAPAGDYEGVVQLEGAQRLHLPIWARTLPAERGAKVLLLDNDGSSSLDLQDYSGYYGNALGELGVDFAYIDLDALAGEPQTLPGLAELQKHEIIIWFTGDNSAPSGSLPVPTPLTPSDQNLLIAYLQSGGALIATGRDASLAVDYNILDPDPIRGNTDLFTGYLNATLVQENVFTGTNSLERTVVGLNAQPWLAGIALDLSTPAGPVGDQTGAGNQGSLNEIAVINTDPRVPFLAATEILRAASVTSGLRGVVGINTASEPTLEKPVADFKYRTTMLSFGLEGVRNDTGKTTRKELLQALLYWHVDRPTVRVEGAAPVTESNQRLTLSAVAETNTSAAFVRYRWDFGDGTPIVETDQPAVTHQYARAGSYQPRVEVTDSWGHRAVSAPGQ